MQAPWFHGDVSKEEAEDLLSSQPKGTYLVRTSVTERSAPFTISKVTKKKTINHQRIQKTSNGQFQICIQYSSKSGSGKSTETCTSKVLVFLWKLTYAGWSSCPVFGVTRWTTVFKTPMPWIQVPVHLHHYYVGWLRWLCIVQRSWPYWMLLVEFFAVLSQLQEFQTLGPSK